MRLRRKKMMLNFKIISLLCCVAIVSVGFASWIITGVNITNNASNGNFTAYESTNSNVSVTVNGWYSNVSGVNHATLKNGESSEPANTASVVFGKYASADSTTYSWLKADGVMNTDNLTVALSFTVSNPSGAAFYLQFDIVDYIGSFTTGQEEAGRLTALIGSKAIAEPVLTLYVGGAGAAENVKSLTKLSALSYKYNFGTGVLDGKPCVLVIEFKWGSACGNESNKNPFNYFNNLAYSATEYSQDNAISYTNVIDVNGAVTNSGTAYTTANTAANAILNDVYNGLITSTVKLALDITGDLT